MEKQPQVFHLVCAAGYLGRSPDPELSRFKRLPLRLFPYSQFLTPGQRKPRCRGRDLRQPDPGQDED